MGEQNEENSFLLEGGIETNWLQSLGAVLRTGF